MRRRQCGCTSACGIRWQTGDWWWRVQCSAGPYRRKEERSVRGRNEQQLDDKEASCISAGGHRTELQFLLACSCAAAFAITASLSHSQCVCGYVYIHAEISLPAWATHYCGSLPRQISLSPAAPGPLSLSLFDDIWSS